MPSCRRLPFGPEPDLAEEQVAPDLLKGSQERGPRTMSAPKFDSPVMFRPGRARLSTNALPTASGTNRKTTGIVKHAFPSTTNAGHVSVSYEVDGTNWKLSVSDDGVGMPDHKAGEKTGLGTSLMKALAQQLEAQVDIASGPEGERWCRLRTQSSSLDCQPQPDLITRHCPLGRKALRTCIDECSMADLEDEQAEKPLN